MKIYRSFLSVLAAVALFALVSLAPGAAVAAVVQQIGFDGGVGTTKIVTLPQATTAGSTIIVVSSSVGNVPTVPTDNLGDTWPAAAIGPTGSIDLTVWLLQNCPAGITSITVNQAAGQGWIIEESGVLASSLDKIASNVVASVNITSGNTATLSQANEVTYGFTAVANGTSYMFTEGSGWDSTPFTNFGGTGGGGYTSGNQGNTLEGVFTFVERKVVAATTPLAATMTQPGAATVTAIIITLKQSAQVTNGVVLSNGHPIRSGNSILFQ